MSGVLKQSVSVDCNMCNICLFDIPGLLRNKITIVEKPDETLAVAEIMTGQALSSILHILMS